MKKLLILVVLIAALAVAGCVEEEINAATNAVQAVPNQTEEKDNGIPLNEVEDDT